jgi:hypothetical protein
MPDFLASLTASQRFFITCIWKPFAEYQQWPIFDYIEAECDKQGFDARQVLASLPGGSLPGVAGFRYGLVWSSSYMPAADTPLQLRVAGLWHLGDPLSLTIADDFLRVLHYLIERRLSAPYDPFKLARVTVTNDEIATHVPEMSPVSAAFLPNLLPQEPTTWQGTTQTNASGGWSIDLFRSILKYQGLSTVFDYLERANEEFAPVQVEPAPAIPSPLDLVATLDYFNAVWQLHFDRKNPIIRLFAAERTARLVYDVSTAEEFSAQVSCLADIFKNMQVSGQEKAPLARLQSSLKSVLPADSASRIDSATDTLCSVADVRNALFQHSGTEHRGVTALTQLGIEYPIADWQTAWATVQRKTINAFNVLREEIQQFHEIEIG